MFRSTLGSAVILLIATFTRADDRPPTAKPPVIRMSVDAEGMTRAAGQRKPFSSLKELRGFLAKELDKSARSAKGKPDVVIGLDRNLEYGKLLDVLEVCWDLKITGLKVHDALDENSSAPKTFALLSTSRMRHLVNPIAEAHKEETDESLWETTLMLASSKDPRSAGRLTWAGLTSYPIAEELILEARLDGVLLEKLKNLPPLFRGKNSRLAVRAYEGLHSSEFLFVLEAARNAGIGKVRVIPAEGEEVQLANLEHGLLPRPSWRFESLHPDENVPDVYIRFDPNDTRGLVEYEELQGRLIPLPLDSPRRLELARLYWWRQVVGLDAPGGLGPRLAPNRDKVVLEAGGSRASEASVVRGLRWLALHQAPEGHWSLDRFNEHAREHLYSTRYRDDRTTGKGMKNDVAGTAFGLLPFLAAGVTHKAACRRSEDAYVNSVSRGLEYLLSRQQKDGGFPGGMYAHALATTTVSEAYALTGDRVLRRSAQAAINYIVEAQDPLSGGWRYQPRQGGDTSVTGWQVTALKTGQMAGLKVPQTTFDGAARWLNACETNDGGSFGYTGPNYAPAMSAVGLLCREYLGTPRRNPNHLSGVKKLKNSPPTGQNIYYEYYATQVMYHTGGDFWEFWNGTENRKGMRDILVESQDKDGSWDPRGDPHGSAGGRIMQTSLSLLSLEVYYRSQPIYLRVR